MSNNNLHNVTHVLVSGITSNYGGVEAFIYQHYKYMDHTKIQLDVLTHVKNPAYQKEIESMGGRFFYIPMRNRYPIKYRKALKQFFQTHAKEYQVYWCNKCMLNNIDFLKYASKYKVPIRILHSHNSSSMDTGLKGRIMLYMHNRNRNKITSYATKYWACSDYAAKWLFPKNIYRENQYTFIPNAVDAKKFRMNDAVREEVREKLHLQENYVIGHIGRFNYQKNHEFLIKIFQKAYEMDYTVRLLLIGTGELEPSVKKQVQDMQLEHAVQFLGVRHDIPDLMQAMDCFVLPSRFEGLPVVAVEAQAAGLPCVMAKDGITKQVRIVESAKFMGLEQSEDAWAKEILNLRNSRNDSYQIIKEQGFDIREAAKRLEKQITKE